MTGRDTVSASLRLIGALAPGETLAANEATDGLATMNRMIDSWSNEGLMIGYETKETFSLSGGTQDYTMGSGGAFNTTRPTRVLMANLLSGTTEYPLRINSDSEWASIQNKSVSSSIPTDLYTTYTYPLVTISLYPVPAVSNSVIIYSWKQLSSISTLDTVLSVQPGVEEALIYNLAVRLAPEYGRAVTGEVAQIAIDSKANVKRINNRPYYLKVDSGLLPEKRYSVITGDFR